MAAYPAQSANLSRRLPDVPLYTCRSAYLELGVNQFEWRYLPARCPLLLVDRADPTKRWGPSRGPRERRWVVGMVAMVEPHRGRGTTLRAMCKEGGSSAVERRITCGRGKVPRLDSDPDVVRVEGPGAVVNRWSAAGVHTGIRTCPSTRHQQCECIGSDQTCQIQHPMIPRQVRAWLAQERSVTEQTQTLRRHIRTSCLLGTVRCPQREVVASCRGSSDGHASISIE